jgi:hypothetical protein
LRRRASGNSQIIRACCFPSGWFHLKSNATGNALTPMQVRIQLAKFENTSSLTSAIGGTMTRTSRHSSGYCATLKRERQKSTRLDANARFSDRTCASPCSIRAVNSACSRSCCWGFRYARITVRLFPENV